MHECSFWPPLGTICHYECAIKFRFMSSVLTVIVGEAANFVAYVYAPAILVTPLGALSIIIR